MQTVDAKVNYQNGIKSQYLFYKPQPLGNSARCFKSISSFPHKCCLFSFHTALLFQEREHTAWQGCLHTLKAIIHSCWSPKEENEPSFTFMQGGEMLKQ